MTDTSATPADPPSSWAVRTLSDGDWADFLRVDTHAFGTTMPDDVVVAERALHEAGRSIGAYDGAELVGVATAFSFRLSVPGSTLPAGGVSWVGVLPTHRRRGVLSALMRHQLTSIHQERREPIAILWASEPQIYGRFGYGQATQRYSLTVPRNAASLRREAPQDPALRLRLTDPADWKLTADVYATVAARRPGVPERDERWWGRAVQDLPSVREGRSELRAVVAEDDEGVRGYARYTTKSDFGDSFGSGVVGVREVMANDPAALAALYRYLFDLDLMGSTELSNLPLDDPLLTWLVDLRKATPRLWDALYVRLVDLPTALSGRTYARDLDIVLDVTDPVCSWNSGRWRLTGGDSGATCTRTDDDAELRLGIEALGAAFLGGTRLSTLAAAGQVTELRPGAVIDATTAFAHDPAPWNPAVF